MAGGQPPLTETAFVLGAQQPEGQRYRRRGQGLERRGLRTQWKKGSRKKKAQMAQPRLPGPVQNAFPDSTVNSVQARTDLPYGPRRAKGFRGNKLRQRAMQPPQTPRTVPHAPYNNNEFLVADKYRRAGRKRAKAPLTPAVTPGRVAASPPLRSRAQSREGATLLLGDTKINQYGSAGGLKACSDTSDTDSDQEFDTPRSLPKGKRIKQLEQENAELRQEVQRLTAKLTAQAPGDGSKESSENDSGPAASAHSS